MKKIVIVVAALLLASAVQAGILFQDDFEGSLRPEWQGDLTDYYISQERAQHGQYSVACLKAGDRHSDKWLYANLGADRTEITLSYWFYDDFNLVNEYLTCISSSYNLSSTQEMILLGMDPEWSDGYHYALATGWNWHALALPRSIGWHRFDIYSESDGSRIYIDGQFQMITGFKNSFKYVYLLANSVSSGPATPGFWDNLKVYDGPPEPVPEPPTLLALCGGVAGIFTLRRRR